MYCECPEFKRCCFCLPLRKGVLFVGYFIIFSNTLSIIFNSLALSGNTDVFPFHTSGFTYIETELAFIISIVLYSIEILFNILLVYGSHQNKIKYVRIYFYFTLATTAVVFVQQIIEMTLIRYSVLIVHSVLLFICYMMLHVYIILLVRSLLKKMEISNQHSYDNQLHQIVSGDIKMDSPPYCPTVIPYENC
ncbi:uncharacterized protein LOC113512863 [Galleria mellonella]|uniref:Uncharacterized protein LOC113512863 n=1 Tax=Galleria mellonella TaxID=7137 RepID=A0A6J1WFG9_GALME|nr:uncharacterized protein LOC113512863 [Galleria mellonella]